MREARLSAERPSATVYTSPHCSPCRQVIAFLRDRGVPVDVRDVTADAAALGELEAEGYLTTPVTRIGDRWIAGFRRSGLEAALAAAAAEPPAD